jgi:hypothetical protein
MRSSDGRIEFPIKNLEDLSKSKKLSFILEKNLDELRIYLEILSDHLKRI